MTDEPVSGQLTGVAGVHFVAAYLSFLGFHAVPTTRNVRGPDLLVSSIDGFRSLTLPVPAALFSSAGSRPKMLTKTCSASRR
jgi:hypothetical protein